MNVVVLVPRRSDGGRRDQVWAWLLDRWNSEHPTWPVIEGHHTDGPFNRSAAVNKAARIATEAYDPDVFVIADADSLVDARQLSNAVLTAAQSGQITFAFDHFRYLGRTMTEKILDGYEGDWLKGVEFTLTGTCSSMVVVPRRLF